MSNQSLGIPFGPYSTARAIDAWWLRFEQEGIEPDTMTVAQAATLIDAAFDVNPCDDPGTLLGSGAEAVEPAVEEEDFGALVQQNVGFNICDLEEDGSCIVKLRVYRSHRGEPYKVNLTNGEILSTVRHYEQVKISETVERSSSFTVKYPFIGAPAVKWLGNLIDENGSTQEPTLEILGSTLNFGKNLTGTFTADFMTEYDLLEIKVYGNEGEQGECRALGFFGGQVEEYDIEMPEVDETSLDTDRYCGSGGVSWEGVPDRVTCYEEVHLVKKCQCSETEVGRTTFERNITCPDHKVHCPGSATDCRALIRSVTETNYVDCGAADSTGDMADPAFYEEHCCEPGSGAQCRIRTMTNRGGLPLDKGPEHYRAIYGPQLRIVAQGPDNGICGETTIEQKLTSQDCCENVSAPGVTPPEKTLRAGEFFTAEASGGKPPYYWSSPVDGLKITPLNAAGDQASIKAGECFCNGGPVIVTDSCDGVAMITISSNEGEWVEDETCIPADSYTYFNYQTMPPAALARYMDNERRVEQWYTVTGVSGTVYDRFQGIDGVWMNINQFMLQGMASSGWEFTDRCVSIDEAAVNPGDHPIEHVNENFTLVAIGEIKPATELQAHPTLGNPWKVNSVYAYHTHIEGTSWLWECEYEDCNVNRDLSIEILPDNSGGDVYVDGGSPPYRWTLQTDQDVTFLQSGTKVAVTDQPLATVISKEICGDIPLHVTDECTSSSFIIRAAEGQWVSKQQIKGDGPDTCHLTGNCGDLIHHGDYQAYELIVDDKKIKQHQGPGNALSGAYPTFPAALTACISFGETIDCCDLNRCESCFGNGTGTQCAAGTSEIIPPLPENYPEPNCDTGIYSSIHSVGDWYWAKVWCIKASYYEYWEWEC